MAVMMEELRSQYAAILEGVHGSEQRLLRSMDERFNAVELRLTALEIAVKQNSADIRKNSEDIARLQAEVRRLDVTLQGKIDQSALDSLERRVAAIESRLGMAAG